MQPSKLLRRLLRFPRALLTAKLIAARSAATPVPTTPAKLTASTTLPQGHLALRLRYKDRSTDTNHHRVLSPSHRPLACTEPRRSPLLDIHVQIFKLLCGLQLCLDALPRSPLRRCIIHRFPTQPIYSSLQHSSFVAKLIMGDSLGLGLITIKDRTGGFSERWESAFCAKCCSGRLLIATRRSVIVRPDGSVHGQSASKLKNKIL